MKYCLINQWGMEWGMQVRERTTISIFRAVICCCITLYFLCVYELVCIIMLLHIGHDWFHSMLRHTYIYTVEYSGVHVVGLQYAKKKKEEEARTHGYWGCLYYFWDANIHCLTSCLCLSLFLLWSHCQLYSHLGLGSWCETTLWQC